MALADLSGQQLIDAAPNAMVVVDEAGLVVLVNQQTEALFGYSREALLGKTIDVLLPERFRDTHPRYRQQFFDSPCVRPMGEGMVLYGRRQNGDEFPVEISLSPLSAENRSFVVSEIRDITEHRQIERSLAGILEASLNEIYIFGANDLRFIQVNEGARKNLGYTMAELRELTPVHIKPHMSADEFNSIVAPLHNNTSQLTFETVHQRKDGSTYPVEVHLQTMQFETQPVFVAIILDITERQQATELLRIRERALASSVNGVIIAEAAPPNYPIIYVNPAFETLTGYKMDEVVGKNCNFLQSEDTNQSARAEIRESLRTGKHSQVTLRNYRKDGTLFWNELYISPVFGSDGLPSHFVGIQSDITQRKEFERELAEQNAHLEQRVIQRTEALREAKDIAENATSTKSRFLAAASHDLRQPLQSLSLYLTAMTHVSDEPQRHEIGVKMRSSLDTMTELLDALLDISKLDSGTITPQTRDFPVSEFLERIVTTNVQQAQEKGLQLTYTSDNCVVHSDPALLQRVIENFVTNAIRYTDSGQVKINCQCTNGIAHVSVTDTGIGIPAEDLDNVFEEYYQLDNGSRDRRKGLGLGLSIVKHIARLLDHPLNVSSVAGQGSSFSINVPLGTTLVEPAQPNEGVPTPPCSAKRPVVLFVDDDPAIVDATTLLLGAVNVELYSALNGDDALAHIENGVSPDIIVSDFRLPGFNGVELVQRVRRATADALPAIIMTGDTSTPEIDAADLSNCTILHKPVNTDRLINLIEDLTAEEPTQ